MKRFNRLKGIGCTLFCMGVWSLTVPALANGLYRSGFPGRRVSAGVRCASACTVSSSGPLVSLVQSNNLLITSALAPTFLFYVPAIATATEVELQIYDTATDQLVYKAVASLFADLSGIVRLDLSEISDGFQLESDKTYHWYTSITCPCDHRLYDLTTHGHVIGLDSEAALLESTAALLPAFQAAMDWSESLATLDLGRRHHPNDAVIEAAWQAMLADDDDFTSVLESRPITLSFETVPVN